MAIIIGDGAFRIWVGKDKKTMESNNIGIRMQPKKFPAGVDLEKTVEQLVTEVETLIYKRGPWLDAGERS